MSTFEQTQCCYECGVIFETGDRIIALFSNIDPARNGLYHYGDCCDSVMNQVDEVLAGVGLSA